MPCQPVFAAQQHSPRSPNRSGERGLAATSGARRGDLGHSAQPLRFQPVGQFRLCVEGLQCEPCEITQIITAFASDALVVVVQD